jgi:hypothetical protein
MVGDSVGERRSITKQYQHAIVNKKWRACSDLSIPLFLSSHNFSGCENNMYRPPIFNFFFWATWLVVLLPFAQADVDPIVIKGSHFFYKTNGTAFFVSISITENASYN